MISMRAAVLIALFSGLPVLMASDVDDLYAEFNSATTEILSQLHHDPWQPAHQGSEDEDTKVAEDPTEQELAEDPWRPAHEGSDDQKTKIDDGAITQMLLSEKAHKAAVKASYQSNVKTIYFHLEEIIKKILAHKQKWTAKYNGDLGKIAEEVLKHKNNAKAAEEKYITAKGKASAAEKLSDLKNKSWQKAENKLKQKINDAKKAKDLLKALYLKGLKQKAGEICMIRKIQCMVAKFNGEDELQKKYCGVCTDDKKAKMIEKWVSGGGGPPAQCNQKLKFANAIQRGDMKGHPNKDFNARQAIDGNSKTRNGIVGSWTGDFGSDRYVSEVNVDWEACVCNKKDSIIVDYSRDGKTWKRFGQFSGWKSWGGHANKAVSSAEPVKARYIRLTGTSNVGHNGWTSMWEASGKGC